LPDSRVPEACTYEARFLLWAGLLIFLLHLGSRRQLDFTLEAYSAGNLANLNRLARTHQSSCPVHDTIDHLLEHMAWTAFRAILRKMAQRLIRMKALDAARLAGRFVLLLDGTHLFSFRQRHCDACLERHHASGTIYMHHVLEAKLLGPAGVVVSVGSEFIDNADALASSSTDAEQIKQDCELKAFGRLAPRLKADFPQLRIVLAGDSLFACGATLQIAATHGWSYVLTLKPGRLPSVWDEFQRLKPLCPKQFLQRVLPDGTQQEFRWVHDLSYTDSEQRHWTFHALECVETSPENAVTHFAWITDLAVEPRSVEEVAQKGGRGRWKIENQAFNRQKNHGPNLGHVYSQDPEKWKAYYLLLQIASVITQIVERGSLINQLAADLDRTMLQLFGSLANIVRRLRETLRLLRWPDECFDATTAATRRISLDTS
jgi:hypothetical protein